MPTAMLRLGTGGAERIKGYPFDEIRGRPFSVFDPPEDIERGKPAYELQVA